jgi:peptidoglycan/xylan/chitin deacetylase (PgdA/CDA1 family)
MKKNPVVFLPFVLDPSLRPAWLRPEDPLHLPFEGFPVLPAHGEGLMSILLPDKPVHAILREGSRSRIAIEYNRILEYMLTERYSMAHKPLAAFLPTTYHWIPPPLRKRLSDLFLFKGKKTPGFPGFPLEKSLEAFCHALSCCGASPPNGWDRPDSWPEGKRYCICLTHDVETGRGVSNVQEVADLEESYGLRSCWYVVGELIPNHREALDNLVMKGHEIGAHGDRHTLQLPYRGEKSIRRTLEALKRTVEGYDVIGYRSPHYQRSRPLLGALPDYFTYDTSIPDADPFSPGRTAGGSCSVFPYRDGALWELPVTVPYEIPLHMGVNPSGLFEFWTEKIRWIEEVGGLILVNTHPESIYLGDPAVRAAYNQLLDDLSGRQDAWYALPREMIPYLSGSPTTTPLGSLRQG